ncbi:hypothetical protein Pam5_35 [Pseudanabaena phage Pam5]|nr:hypothetical protein Pam5_35 [Pseudanabaena phage Pam5]
MTIEPISDERLAAIRAGLEGLPEGPWTVEDRYETGNRDGQRFNNGPAAVVSLSDCETHPVADCSCNHTCRMGYEQEAIAAHIARLDPQTVAALLARLDKAEAGWQPIETAPKDGTRVLVYSGQESVQCASWWRDGDSGWAEWCSPDGYTIFDTTHWRPLPPNPTA